MKRNGFGIVALVLTIAGRPVAQSAAGPATLSARIDAVLARPDTQVKSRAAGHVHAKTGTFSSGDLLNKGAIVNGKGLAGYMTTADGRHLAFAIYANNVPVKRRQRDHGARRRGARRDRRGWLRHENRPPRQVVTLESTICNLKR